MGYNASLMSIRFILHMVNKLILLRVRGNERMWSCPVCRNCQFRTTWYQIDSFSITEAQIAYLCLLFLLITKERASKQQAFHQYIASPVAHQVKVDSLPSQSIGDSVFLRCLIVNYKTRYTSQCLVGAFHCELRVVVLSFNEVISEMQDTSKSFKTCISIGVCYGANNNVTKLLLTLIVNFPLGIEINTLKNRA